MSNHFLKLLEDLLDINLCEDIHDPHQDIIEEQKETKRNFLFFKKTTSKLVRKPYEDLRASLTEETIRRHDNLFNKVGYHYGDKPLIGSMKETISYDFLYDFCEFVKAVEYLIFYPNSSDNELYVEANDFKFEPDKKQKKKNPILWINIPDYLRFRIELEHIDEEVFDKPMDTIKITITRLYTADKSSETIICIDEISDDNCSTINWLFLRNLNNTIYDYCYKYFKNIINSIIKETGVTLE